MNLVSDWWHEICLNYVSRWCIMPDKCDIATSPFAYVHLLCPFSCEDMPIHHIIIIYEGDKKYNSGSKIICRQADKSVLKSKTILYCFETIKKISYSSSLISSIQDNWMWFCRNMKSEICVDDHVTLSNLIVTTSSLALIQSQGHQVSLCSVRVDFQRLN